MGYTVLMFIDCNLLLIDLIAVNLSVPVLVD